MTTPLHKAVSAGNLKRASDLIYEGADVNATDIIRRDTPLHVAALRSTDIDMVKLLLNANADILATDSLGHLPLHLASWNCKNIKIVILLIETAVNANFDMDIYLNTKSRMGYTPMHVAAESSDSTRFLPLIKVLIRSGGDLRAGGNCGKTPLHVAVYNFENPDIVESLMQQGADPNFRDRFGYSSLHEAANSRNSRVVKILLKYGAGINAEDNENHTPLYHATKSIHISFTRLLIPESLSDGEMKIPLYGKHKAPELGNANILKTLIDNGANVTKCFIDVVRSLIKKTDSWTYRETVQEKSLRVLIKYVDVNRSDSEGKNILATVLKDDPSSTQELRLFHRIIIEHIAKLVHQDLEVHSSLLNYITRRSHLDNYFKSCRNNR